jgi:hypothetical protein
MNIKPQMPSRFDSSVTRAPQPTIRDRIGCSGLPVSSPICESAVPNPKLKVMDQFCEAVLSRSSCGRQEGVRWCLLHAA